MKVLTVKQPFASLIAEGLKEYEFRSWKTNYRGELYIHAGKGVDKNRLNMLSDYNIEYKKGAIIAKVNLVDCILVDEKMNKELNQKNPKVYTHDYTGCYAWKLEDVEKLDNVIEINGKLGLWNYEQ